MVIDGLTPRLVGQTFPWDYFTFARDSGVIAKPSGMDHPTSGWRLGI